MVNWGEDKQMMSERGISKGKEDTDGMEGCQTLPSLQFKEKCFPDLPLIKYCQLY